MGTAAAADRPGSLPAGTTSFVGRKRDVAEVKRLLSKARLVTLTGVGGVGKTTLALHTAAELRRAFPDGVWFVELADLTDSDLLAHTVLEALGVRDDTGRDQADVLADHLRGRRILVILDNCEHLIEVCAASADRLLRVSPGLRFLVTSRERLGIPGEHLWQVAPLPLPAPRIPLRSGAWRDYPAMALFAERAAAVEPGFVVTDENQALIANVCRMLAGIPLAIELAAVRVRALSLDELATRLADNFHLLAKGERGGLPRHQTLLAAVEWSHDLCGAAERVLWARASVFGGGFSLSAAEFVCAGEGLSARSVLGHLAGLVDKSVLLFERDGDRTRYRLLEPLRQFGRAKLHGMGDEDAVLRRHRDYYLAQAERSERDWFGPKQAEICARTKLEHANLRAALDYCLATPSEGRTGLKLAGTLWFYWAGCGVLGEGRHWLDHALETVREGGKDRLKALWVNGYVSTLQGDVARAVTLLGECRTEAGRVGDEAALAYAVHRLGCNALVGDDVGYAKDLFQDARIRYRRLGELNGNVMLAGIEMAIASIFLGELEEAAELCEEARAIGAAHGEEWAYAYAIYVLALVALNRGEFEPAIGYARSCLRIKRTFNDLLGMVLSIEVLAWIESSLRHWARAATLLGCAGRIWQSVGYPMFGSKYFGAPHGDCEARTREALGDSRYAVLARYGSEFTLEEAVAFALDEAEGTESGPVAEVETVLTDREHEVALLITDGLSNREIADRLVISRRTAEGHVQRILRKLDFDSRAQIAAWVTRTAVRGERNGGTRRGCPE
ncbi:protein kinase/LuxR family transcriptional regulator [Amycolatopsis japonica]|uniref:Protein kinase/LuxR family transcriptional regulator n=1 Tax=Amycolatopsis japonica TaxID=208439 RepID=A0A075V1Q4_9PSEU|nr:LuxR C-terminal-related transcriptional regulator [Amycolatopsis japonica]AIG76515.1 protein kinase/LuxR family transcriptional regulator [Amycolatopsis japonica]